MQLKKYNYYYFILKNRVSNCAFENEMKLESNVKNELLMKHFWHAKNTLFQA